MSKRKISKDSSIYKCRNMLHPVRLGIKKQLKLSKDLLFSGSKSLVSSCCEKLHWNDVTFVNVDNIANIVNTQ